MPHRSRKFPGSARLNFAILTHNALADTERCLRTLAEHTPELFQVFVVDNASTDGTPRWLQERTAPWLHWQLNSQNRGVPGGRNDLLDFAQPHVAPGDWLVFCDNDLEFTVGWLDPFRRAMAAFPQAGILGKTGHFIELQGDRRILLAAPASTSRVDVVSGGYACFVRSDAARSIGAFDENLGLFWHEDDDYCVRALQLGADVVAVPEAEILHHEHASGVALDGLREGGSRPNQAYLTDKWRKAGWIDRDGWVRRQSGPYVPPEVRDELRARSGAPIGRGDFAAAWSLLDAMVDQQDPAAWFKKHRQPVPRCAAAWLALHRNHAAMGGEGELARQLDRIRTVLGAECYAAVLRPTLRGPTPAAGAGQRIHGLCSNADFDDPQWLAFADRFEPGHPGRDPHSRHRAHWEAVTLLRGLEGQQALGPASRVLVGGELAPRTLAWLREHAAGVDHRDECDVAVPSGHDVVILVRTTDPETIAHLVATAAPRALFALVGDAILNGAPRVEVPVPMQLEHDLLARAGLRPVAALDLSLDDGTLEACADRREVDARQPQLVSVAGSRLLTSFVIFARRSAVPAPAAVLVPASARRAVRATVGVDLRTLSHADSVSRGIGHYTVHHLAALARRAPELRFVGYLQKGAELPSALQQPNVMVREVDAFAPGAVGLMHLPDPMNLSLGFDAPLRVFRHPKTTITFHDLTPLHHYLEGWPRRNRETYLDRLRQIEASSAHLLCNSRFTADDVVATLKVRRDRVTPVLAGLNTATATSPDDTEIAAVLTRLGIRAPFVLHVGAHDPHKNFATSLNAFLHARARTPLQLVVVGAIDQGIEMIADFCAQKGVPDVVFTGYLPRTCLIALYGGAVGLLFLSKAEGFGFPLLEAMAAGCPVVASNATSHPEVVGDAGVLVDATDAEAAGRAILRLLQDPAEAQHLRRAGRERAARFTWDAVAERTLAVWRPMLGLAPAPVPQARSLV